MEFDTEELILVITISIHYHTDIIQISEKFYTYNDSQTDIDFLQLYLRLDISSFDMVIRKKYCLGLSCLDTEWIILIYTEFNSTMFEVCKMCQCNSQLSLICMVY